MTISNTAPSATVSLDQASAQTNDLLSATAVLSDIDVEQTLSVNYEWHVLNAAGDSVVQSGSDSSLDGSVHFEKGDEVYVVVTPNDGVENGASATSGIVVISNSDPTDATATITPDSGVYNDSTVLCDCLLYTSPSPRDQRGSRMPSSA